MGGRKKCAYVYFGHLFTLDIAVLFSDISAAASSLLLHVVRIVHFGLLRIQRMIEKTVFGEAIGDHDFTDVNINVYVVLFGDKTLLKLPQSQSIDLNINLVDVFSISSNEFGFRNRKRRRNE